MAALASQESAKITSYLMALPNPDVALVTAVYAATDFFKATQINGKAWSSGVLVSDRTRGLASTT